MPSKNLSVTRENQLRFSSWAERRNRLHSIGVRVTETTPEIRMATQMVIANSLNKRPSTPPMNSTGMNTAASESFIDTMVKPISPEPLSAACKGGSPISMCRTMFSSMTMASSTTNPMERIRAIMERLSRLKSSRYITAKVPTMEKGSAMLGMMVADKFRRNRKITITTSDSVRTMVNSTSVYDSRMVSERSERKYM